jgi:hypothetical protein
MRVLVVGTSTGAVEHTSDVLRDAGHEVAQCHRAGDAAFPCRGLSGDACPLEGPGVDVVVTARNRRANDGMWLMPAPLEDGAVCALRRRIPMVVHGLTSMHPFTEWAAATSHADDELLAVVEEVARMPMQAHSDLARETARQVLQTSGLPVEGLDAAVRRIDGRLRVMLTLPPGAESGETSVTAKVLGTLRSFDPGARGIDLGYAAAS